MTIDELNAYGANTREGLHRCMDNESFYFRMIRMIPEDPNYQKLYDAIARGDLAAGFDAAHAIKGSTGNLALTPIYGPACEITELLRARTETDYGPLLSAIRSARDQLAALCRD